MTEITAVRSQRELHVIDAENLLGGTRFTALEVRRLRRAYRDATSMETHAHVVLAATADQAALEAGLGWDHSRLLLRHGPDGADLELLDVLSTENVAARFGHVYIASGDGIFAQAAAALAASGVRVTVVSRSEALSAALRLAAASVILLDVTTPADPTAPGRAA